MESSSAESDGTLTISIAQGERLVVELPHDVDSARQQVDGENRALPIGSTWDDRTSTFYWQPAPGFLGDFTIVFSDSSGQQSKELLIRVTPAR